MRAKWDKSDRERQILYDLTYMWNLKKTKTKNQQNSQLQRKGWWLPEVREVGCEMGEGVKMYKLLGRVGGREMQEGRDTGTYVYV